MTVLFLLLALIVLAVAAALAAGVLGGGLAEPATTLPGTGLPEGPIPSWALSRLRFDPALRGYRMDQVDTVLDRLAGELSARDAELVRRGERIAQLEQDLELSRAGSSQD
ncbi:MAG: DivIVA domain-containing protein [Kineosporiaceae bacterium]